MLSISLAEQRELLAFLGANFRQVPNSIEHTELCSPLAYEIARTRSRIDELEGVTASR